ncbi:AhpC/TSA family protein [Flavobacterium silvisoli]|uniref:AhpC/TSA family protein n=1 Tax=Flavobacterium silvisoli TaxID=2529433 RepID=A0A4Q9Z1W9_9FLAO|nr:TlpA disulfide reductase family protein [Flavobacterium silvisoli]TBX70288.1 AhpC/TSA family protein [Flavobacterium silvisoli]
MKKIFVLVAAATTLFSCSKVADGEYLITGKVKGLKSGLVFLQKENPNGMGLLTVDTVKIVDEKFEIKGKADEPAISLIEIQKVNGKVPFILEEGEITIEVDKDSIFKSKIAGTYSNDEFYKFNEESGKIKKGLQQKVMDFQMKNMAKMNEATKNKDTATINTLRKQYEDLQKGITDFTFNYPKSHPKSFISVLIVQAMFNNPKFKPADIEAVYNTLDETLKKTKPGKKIVENLENIKKQEKAKSNVSIGAMAPNFKAPNPEGKMVSLKESLGKATLIDFWASWCAPCRQANPSVVALYNEFHAKGLNIISVSLDNDAAKWKEAIAKDKLTWTQVSNLKEMNDPIALQYGVNQIPSTFLLGADGKIVAVDLSGEALKAKISELLAAK